MNNWIYCIGYTYDDEHLVGTYALKPSENIHLFYFEQNKNSWNNNMNVRFTTYWKDLSNSAKLICILCRCHHNIEFKYRSKTMVTYNNRNFIVQPSHTCTTYTTYRISCQLFRKPSQYQPQHDTSTAYLLHVN